MTTRRSFIKNTGTISAFAWLMPSLIKKSMSKNVGLELWTVRDIIYKDVKGIIEKIAEAGYKDVEPFGYSIKDKFWGIETKEFKNILSANGLKMSSGHYDINSYFRNGDTTDLNACIESANEMGASYLVIPGVDDALKKDVATCEETADKMNKAGELCKKAGLKLAYHNHNAEFRKLDDTYGYEIFLKKTDPELVHFEMDIYWVVRGGKDPLALISQFPGRFPLWHVKDMDKQNHDLNTEIGNGTIDFKSIFKEAKKAGLKQFYVEQEHNYKPDILGSIKTSCDYIKKNLI